MPYPPPQPDRGALRPEEVEPYDRLVARQAAYDYVPFVKTFLHPEVLEAFPGTKVQPYFGALLGSPLIADLISELGVVMRTRGEHADSHSQADREWVDMVLCQELGCNWVIYVHAPDAIAVGVRPAAIQALRAGRDDLLSADELEKAEYIRAVIGGTVTEAQYARLQAAVGSRGAVELTAFIGFLIMTIRLNQAFGVQDIGDEALDEWIRALADGKVALPDPRSRVPALARPASPSPA
jgi:alkylhydroperoxidase family enzyme